MSGIVVMSQNKQYLDKLGHEYLVKGNAVPLEAWTDPEGSKSLTLPDFKTIGICRWSGCQSYTPAAFTRQEIFLVLISVRG